MKGFFEWSLLTLLWLLLWDLALRKACLFLVVVKQGLYELLLENITMESDISKSF